MGWKAALARAGLRAASWPYGAVVRTRNVLFDRGWKKIERAAVPVISVGNLTAGGTGKTPCVEYIAGYLRRQETCVAILSRGYGSEGGMNDEALVLEENCPDVPHLQGVDRVELARIAIEELESEILVLDDGFQHRRLGRNLDVVLLDATDPWGQGYLLPRGLLREPKSSLQRAGVIVLTRCDQAESLETLRTEVQRLVPGKPTIETIHRPTQLVNGENRCELGELKRHPVAAFCGIGNPGAFERTLRDLGANVTNIRTFADHHAYTREDIDGLRTWASQQPADVCVVTTQKDFVKIRLPELGGRPLWALRIELAPRQPQGMDALERELDRIIGAGT